MRNQNDRRRKVNKRQNSKNRNYSVLRRSQAPVAFSSTVRYSDPMISSSRRSRSSGQIECRIRHRELVTIIDGSIDFTVTQYPVQPGITLSFPWLSQMAPNWENYKFKRIAFRYISRSSTSFTGAVIIAPDYDASDSSPTSYQSMSAFQNVVSDAPWKDILCILSPKSTSLVGNSRYLRSGPLNNNEDIKLYDVANLYVATVGQAGTSTVGELWVEYDVIFEIPQIQTFRAVSNVSAGYLNGSSTLSTTHLMGVPDGFVFSGNVVVVASSNTLTLTNMIAGNNYIITYSLFAGTTITTAPSLTVVSGLQPLDGFTNYASTNGTTVAIATIYVVSDSDTAVITMGGVTVLVAPTYAELDVSTFIDA